jgi:hypothetical protein
MTNNKFRDAVEVHFGDRKDIENKSFLSILMRKRGFHQIRDKKTKETYFAPPTQKQLDGAWNELKRIGSIKEEQILVTKRKRHYRMITIDRSKHNVITPKGFKAMQIRDRRTGRIIGWA